MQKITPFLWFDDKAEEAMNFYATVFKNSKILGVSRYGAAGAKASGMPEGSVMTASFELEGLQFTAINGGDFFKFSGAISFVVNCETQEEVDYYWEKLSEGGEKGQCGWINHDKFGVTWQIVPTVLETLIADPDPQKAGRVMEAMLKMTKIIIADLQKAAEQK
ncbi:MAG: VOC family protein [Candidatus Moranbacteria bacterium]|nr:VOC family protein [Candidatus Moranbacteria bacterium]